MKLTAAHVAIAMQNARDRHSRDLRLAERQLINQGTPACLAIAERYGMAAQAIEHIGTEDFAQAAVETFEQIWPR